MRALVLRLDYLPLSETFVYDEIIDNERIDSFVYYKNRINAEIFFEVRALPMCSTRNTHPARAVLNDFLKQRYFKHRFLKKIFCREAPQVAKLIKHLDIRIIHAHFIEDAFFALLLKEHADVPLVVSLHGGYDSNVFPRLYPKKFLELMARVDLCLARSNYMREKLINFGADPGKIAVHYGGVDINFWRSNGSPNGSADIAFIGRLVEKKGADRALSAVASLMSCYPDIRFHIIGGCAPLWYRILKHISYFSGLTNFIEGSQFTKEAISGAIKNKKLQGRIFCYGPLDRTKTREILRKANVLLAPSQFSHDGDCEGLPQVILEAQALGIPVASTFHTGIPEAIQHRHNGLLCEEGDVVGLKENLACLIDDPGTRRLMGERGRRIIEEKFNLEKQKEKLERIFLNLCQK